MKLWRGLPISPFGKYTVYNFRRPGDSATRSNEVLREVRTARISNRVRDVILSGVPESIEARGEKMTSSFHLVEAAQAAI